jgi:hypothetical protein
MLRAAAHGLHRGPHVAAALDQVPARRDERPAVDTPAFVLRFWRAGLAVREHLGPDDVAIAANDRVRPAFLPRLVREQRRVDAAVDDERSGGPRLAPDFVAAQGVAGVDADADDVARCETGAVEDVERLILEERDAVTVGGRRGEDEQPARGDDGDAKGHVAWIDEEDSHAHFGTKHAITQLS